MENGEVRQYLTFALEGETYAVDVRGAQTVLENGSVTRIPNMPDHVLGLIDFRGRAIPLVDLRALLRLSDKSSSDQGMVVIMEIPRPESGDSLVVGAAVDAVQEVIALHDADLERPDDLGLGVDTSFIAGIARNAEGGTLFLILKPDLMKYINTNLK